MIVQSLIFMWKTIAEDRMNVSNKINGFQIRKYVFYSIVIDGVISGDERKWKCSDEFDSLLSSVFLPIFTPLKSFLRLRCCPGAQTLSGAPKTKQGTEPPSPPPHHLAWIALPLSIVRRFESLGEYSLKFYTGRLSSEVQLLSLPFVDHFHSHKMYLLFLLGLFT